MAAEDVNLMSALKQQKMGDFITFGLKKTLKAYSQVDAVFSPIQTGNIQLSSPTVAAGAVRFESDQLSFELVLCFSEEFFHWLHTKIFSKTSTQARVDADHLVREVLNISMGVANSHFSQAGKTGRYSFPIPLRPEEVSLTLKVPRQQAVTMPVECDKKKFFLEFYPAGSTKLLWKFDTKQL